MAPGLQFDRLAQEDEELQLVEDGSSQAENEDLREVQHSPSPSRGPLKLAVLLIGVIACLALAFATATPAGTSNADVPATGIVQLDEQVVQNMHKKRDEMQASVNELLTKVEKYKRQDKPDRLQHMKKRFQESRDKLQGRVDAKKQVEMEKKLASLDQTDAAKAKTLRNMVGDAKKGLANMRSKNTKKASREFSPQERRRLQMDREKMKASVSVLNGKLDKLQRAEKPNRLHNMRDRLEAAQRRLKAHVKNLNSNRNHKKE